IREEGALLTEPLQIVAAAEVKRRLESGETVIGPDLKEMLPEVREMWPDASTLLRLAGARIEGGSQGRLPHQQSDDRDFVDGSQLEPIYLRPTAFVKATPGPTFSANS